MLMMNDNRSMWIHIEVNKAKDENRHDKREIIYYLFISNFL